MSNTKRDTMDMAREAGMVYREFADEFANANTDGVDLETLKAFEALVRADERDGILRMSGNQWFNSQSRYDEAILARGNT